MEKAQVRHIRHRMGKDRIHFQYAKDDYALFLLKKQVEKEALPLRDIKQSPFGRLLDKPRLKTGLAQWGDGRLTRQRLDLLADPRPVSFRITFAEWGSRSRKDFYWNQTSRRGYNLVLQLNFNGRHNKTYRKLIRDLDYHPFHCESHPARAGKDFTLAWARLDISADYRYALIEEIQNDWSRSAREEIYTHTWRRREANGQLRTYSQEHTYSGFAAEDLKDYLSRALHPFDAVWDEAILTAALWFLFEEVGVERVFYHTYRLGCYLKKCRPPRSLYTRLPKKFCFRETTEYPAFLGKRLRRRHRRGQVRFFAMENQKVSETLRS